MNTTSKIAFGVLAGLGIAGSAAVLAQEHGPMAGHGARTGHCQMAGNGPMAGQGPMMGRHMTGDPAAHLESLKTELKLTDEQQPAWDTFEKAVREQAKTMTEAGPRQAGKHDPDAHLAFMEQRLAGMKTIHKARTELFNVLTPEQQSVFDQQHGPHGRHQG